MGDLSDATLHRIDQSVNFGRVRPSGSEGYRTADVTLGGVDTKCLDPKTVKAVLELHFIGEVVERDGLARRLQFPMGSGWCAGQAC